MGATLTTVKRVEAEELLKLGAQELDMVVNISALKSGERALVRTDIAAVVEVARDGGALLKVILETPLLTLEEKLLVCHLALEASADAGRPARADSTPAARSGVVAMFVSPTAARFTVPSSRSTSAATPTIAQSIARRWNFW